MSRQQNRAKMQFFHASMARANALAKHKKELKNGKTEILPDPVASGECVESVILEDPEEVSE